MAVLLITSLAAWLVQREPVPRRVRIATGVSQGLYHKLGVEIQQSMAEQVRSDVEVVETDGSEENFQLLLDDQADLAIVQGGSVPIEEVSVVTPLFREWAFVIARKGEDIQSVYDLVDRHVSLGPIGSGNRNAALKVLDHFGVEENDLVGNTDLPFAAMGSDDSIEGAIVIAGIEHPSLQKLLSTNRFDVVPIRSARALEMTQPFVRRVEIPRGLFAEHPPVPPEPTPTIATTAYLVCRNDAASDLVQAALTTIHEESLRLKVPTLIERRDAPQWTVTKMHPAAQRYFNPEDNIGAMVAFMESIVAAKELLFAIGAGMYLLWIRWRRLKERELAAQISRQKDRLDSFLMETLDIEREQADTTDVEKLQGYLDGVTNIKLQALQEFTEEDLRGNQEFSIFLDQCSHLISRIQRKLLRLDPNANV